MGTQRLPRLIGAAAALDMIVSGKPMKSEAIARLGYFDRIAEGDILPAAVASYFSFLHVGIQTFVFSLLFLIYVSEAVGEPAE